MARHQPSDSEQAGRQGDSAQWSHVATAPDQMVAEMWQQLLSEESIPSMLAPQDAISFLGIAQTPVRLLVPRDLCVQAREALARNLEDSDGPTETNELPEGQ